MKTNHLIKFLFFQLLICSCNNKSDIQHILTNGKNQFWDIYDTKRGYITGSYSFNIDGACYYYTYSRQGKRSKIFDDDIVYPHTWTLHGDTIINIQGLARKILDFKKDTFILENRKNMDTILLVRVKS